ncbi:DUF2521 family protein [Anaerobacillus sp. HL2]|nr:DUF2521 family protein [Anaerobacillus sp. HL2]
MFADQKAGINFAEDACVDFAIDAYLLGAEFSRFGYYGENELSVRRRCRAKSMMSILITSTTIYQAG